MRRDVLDLLSAPVGADKRSRWCLMTLVLPEAPAAALRAAACFVGFRDGAGNRLGDAVLLRSAPGPRATAEVAPGDATGLQGLCFVPAEAAALRVRAAGLGAVPHGGVRLELRPVTRLAAALRLARRNRRNFAALVRGRVPRRAAELGKWRERVREVLAHALADSNRMDLDYGAWTTLFDAWSGGAGDRAGTAQAGPAGAPAAPWPGPTIGYAVLVADRAASAAALQASLAAIGAQGCPAPHAVLHGPGRSPGSSAADEAGGDEAAWRERLAGLPASLGTEYVGILQAGEILPAHASWQASRCLLRDGRPDVAIADEDALSPSGSRHAPLFKPVPNHLLMLSGTLSRGLWLVRADMLGSPPPAPTPWAEALRLEVWLRRREGNPRFPASRIPYVLTHRRGDTEAAPASELARIVDAHLDRTGLPLRAEPAWPVRLRLREDRPSWGSVVAVVPSTLRRPHSLRCILAVLRGTAYRDFQVRVAVSQPGPPDAAQQDAARQIGSFPNAKVEWLRAERFNFSWVNNQVWRRAGGDAILLLNDDVSPIRPDWLDWMLAGLADPSVGAVGARLLYPGGDVQHGGVIMGMGGLCDHAHRHLPRDRPGYAWRAVLPQELSAVTAACMLVRRPVLERVDGLDEAYPSAFNDVDLCLRIREAGLSVAYMPQAELYHHELQTYGSHYAGERETFHGAEVARMQARWAEACRADPFHNPNLSLENGREWELAFPPRVDPAPEWHG